MHRCTKTDVVKAAGSWKQSDQAAFYKSKLKVTHKLMLDILKPLPGCRSVRFQVNADKEIT